MVAHPDLYDVEYVAAVFFAITVLATTLRLYLRVKRGTLWWDDYFALLGMLSMSLLVAGTVVLTNNVDKARSALYLLVVGYYIPIWSVNVYSSSTPTTAAYLRQVCPVIHSFYYSSFRTADQATEDSSNRCWFLHFPMGSTHGTSGLGL